MRNPERNILEHLEDNQYRDFRSNVVGKLPKILTPRKNRSTENFGISKNNSKFLSRYSFSAMVLSTDMANHFEKVEVIKNVIRKPKDYWQSVLVDESTEYPRT